MVPTAIASSGTCNIPPAMGAFVILPQPLRLDADRPSHVHAWSGNVGGDDGLHLLLSLYSVLGSCEEPCFIPLSTCAGLPLRGAEVAELVSASARHVVTADGELNEVAASRTALPP